MKPIFTKKRVVIGLLAFTALTGTAAYFHFRDDPAPDLSRFPQPAFDTEVYARVKIRCDSLKSHYKEYAPVEPGDIDEFTDEFGLNERALRRDPNALRGLRRHLAENKEALVDAEALLRMDRFATPQSTKKDPMGPVSHDVPALRNSVQLIERRAILHAMENRFVEAWDDNRLITLNSKARHAEGCGCLINYLTNVALDEIARRLAVRIAYLDTDSTRIIQVNGESTTREPSANSLRSAIVGEIHFCANVLHSDRAREIFGLFLKPQTWAGWKESPSKELTSLWLHANFLPNATLRQNITRMTPLIDTPDAPLPQQNKESSGFSSLLRRNAGGIKVSSASEAVYPLVQRKYFHQKASHRLTRIALALRVHQLSHDEKYPATLDAVTTNFAPADLTDPFDGKPLRYDDKTGKVWSVGKDLKDDAGFIDEEGESKDIVVAPPVLTPVPAK